MEIMDIKNQYVKLSKGSITVKDDNGKTKGLVKGLTRFLDLQANKKTDYSKLLRNSGVWGNITGNISNQSDLQSALNAKANTASLATVASSGSYNDLSNKGGITKWYIQ